MLDFLFVILWNLFRFSPACKPRSVYCFRCHYSNTFLKSNNDKVTVIRIITKNHFPLCAKIDKKKKPDEWCCCIKTNLKNIHSFIFFFSPGLTKKKWKKVRTTRPRRIVKHSVYATLTRLRQVLGGAGPRPFPPFPEHNVLILNIHICFLSSIEDTYITASIYGRLYKLTMSW